MTEREFQDKLSQLMDQIEQAPETERESLRDIARETRDRHDRMRRIVTELQDSLDYLRLSVKYLVFDLEATRRENLYLRKMLEENHDDDRGHDGR